jgi:hypothetical protein
MSTVKKKTNKQKIGLKKFAQPPTDEELLQV